MTRTTALKALVCLACAPAAGCFTTPGMLGNLEDDGGGDGGGSEDGDGGSATSQGEGSGGGSDGGSGEAGDEVGSDDGPEPGCAADVGVSSHRVLDRHKWANAVDDLLPTGTAGVTLAVDEYNTPFYVGVANANTGPAFAAAADAVVEGLGAGDFGCSTAADDDSCVLGIIEEVGPRAWRRGLTEDEYAELLALPGADVDERARAVVAAILSSPLFYDITGSGTEDPVDPERIVLNARSIATRIAHLVWNSVPDAELLQRAEAGELSDPLARREEVQRMLTAPQARRMAGDYVEQWLGLDPLREQSKTFAAWADTLPDVMITETRLFAGQVLVGPGTLAAMLTAPTSVINGELASAVYTSDIVGPVPAGAAFEPVEFDAQRRGGVYSLAAFNARYALADIIGFTGRGMAIRQGALCQVMPPPPDGIFPLPSPDFEADSRQEAQQAAMGDPECTGCHALVDPITFGFDHYDAMGRWQETLTPLGGVGGPPNTIPVDPHGEVAQLGEFEDRDGLMALLLASEDARQCFVANNVSFAFGRFIGDDDACLTEELYESFTDSEGSIPLLLEDIAAHDAFVLLRL